MVNYIYDIPSRQPQDSAHWKALDHQSGDETIENFPDLRTAFTQTLQKPQEKVDKKNHSGDSDNNNAYTTLALWSCLFGYCEALTTHKDPLQRFQMFPIPIDALSRLVQTKFRIIISDNDNVDKSNHQNLTTAYRQAAQLAANWIWSSVKSKSNSKDELHANSLYTVLQNNAIDGKSIDCFAAALCTVIALKKELLSQLLFANNDDNNYSSSCALTLSEDHAYVTFFEPQHNNDTNENDRKAASSSPFAVSESKHRCTAEVAIPGNTKAQRAKRGQDIAKTFAAAKDDDDDDSSRLTPETSWLYMAKRPVYCSTPGTILAAALANTNPQILLTSRSGGSKHTETYSQPLLMLKRDLLWVLKDMGHLDEFPFAMCELGYAEEHITSERGQTLVDINYVRPESSSSTAAAAAVTTSMTNMEALYYAAIQCSQTMYLDQQVYPYCYMAYFHKDGGQRNEPGGEDVGNDQITNENESRLGIAMEYYAQAARAASQYNYQQGDTLQLTKVMTKISEFIVHEILTDPIMSNNNSNSKAAPRIWTSIENALAVAKWLIKFYDYLLLWEESSSNGDGNRFLPILQSDNRATGVQASFALLPQDIRAQAFASMLKAEPDATSQSDATTNDSPSSPTHHHHHHHRLQSQRLRGALGSALQKSKISVTDMHLTIILNDNHNNDGGGRGQRRRRKRKER